MTTPKPRVLLTMAIDPAGLALLEPAADVAVASSTGHAVLRQEAASADAIIVLGAYLPADICTHAPRLIGCIRCGAGVDLIPVETATACGVIVANVPGVNAAAVAEYCIAQFLQHARNIAGIDRTFRLEGWSVARALSTGIEGLHGKTLGIVGVGHIGSRLAAIGHQAFGMRVLGHRRQSEQLPAYVQATCLDALFAGSDYIALCCPLTAQTRHLADARRIALMKRSAFLVNVSRGPVIDQSALTDALRARRIGGAGLDVFDTQPLAPDDPLLALDNVVLTPHLAGISLESTRITSRIAAEETLRILAGGKPINFVNPEVWEAENRRRARFAWQAGSHVAGFG